MHIVFISINYNSFVFRKIWHNMIGLGLWCLTPLSTIVQLVRGDHFYCWGKPEYPEKTTDLSQVTDHCRQRAPVGIVLSSSGTSQLGMFDIQATTKSKYYDHILYLESRRCRYRSIIFVCFYLYASVVNLIDYSNIDKMMDINNEKC